MRSPDAAAGRILAALLVLLGLLGRELGVERNGPESASHASVDAETAWRMHRVALAVASPRLAQVDRTLTYPEARGVTQLPVFDEVCALVARVGLGEESGGVGRLPERRSLTRLLRGAGPLLAALTLLLLYATLRGTMGASVGEALCGLGAVLFFPGFVELGVPGVLAIEALGALLGVLCLRSLLSALRATDPLDGMTCAMLAGGGLGLGLSTSPHFVLVYVAALVGWYARLASARGEGRGDLARAALLFWITCALLARLPSLGGPWLPSDRGPLVGWSEAVDRALLCGVLPLVLALALPSARLSVRGLVGIAAVALAASTALLGLDADVRELFAATGGSVFGGVSAWVAGVGGLAVLALAVRRSRGGELAGKASLFTLGALTLTLGFALPSLHALALLPLAWAVALLARTSGRGVAWASGVVGAAFLVLFAGRAEARAEPRAAWIEACAWIEAHTPSDGAWGAATARRSSAVASGRGLGPWLAWFARRASVTPEDPRVEQGRSALLGRLAAARDLEELARLGQAAGISAWLLGPGSAQELGLSPPVVAELEELRHGTEAGDAPLRRAWASASVDGTPVVVLLPALPEPGRDSRWPQASGARGR